LKNLILCFSATGNSYYIAKKIADRTDDCEIKMINEITEENFATPERLGIIFPIHASMEPYPVDNFITEILGKADDKTNLKYVYAISNASVNFSFWGIKRCEMLLKREGITLTYANHVKMPSNYFVKESKDSDKKNIEIIEKSNVKIDKIIEDVETMLQGLSNKQHNNGKSQTRICKQMYCLRSLHQQLPCKCNLS